MLFIVLVVFATLLVIAGMTVATVADGGQAAAVDVIILKIAVNSGIISAGASGELRNLLCSLSFTLA